MKETFNSLDTADLLLLEQIAELENDVEDASAEIFSKAYSELKEKLFENFYISHDIESVIVDSSHPYHALVMRLYAEYMESAWEFDNETQIPDPYDVNFYLDSDKKFSNLENIIYQSENVTETFEKSFSEISTCFHSNTSEKDIYQIEYKIKILIEILFEYFDSDSIEEEMTQCFLKGNSLNSYSDQLNDIILKFKSKKNELNLNLSKINQIAQNNLQLNQKKHTQKELFDLRGEVEKLKATLLSLTHDTYRDLDLLHERLHSFYESIETFKCYQEQNFL